MRERGSPFCFTAKGNSVTQKGIWEASLSHRALLPSDYAVGIGAGESLPDSIDN